MKKYKFFILLSSCLLVCFFGPVLKVSALDFVKTGGGCFPEVMVDSLSGNAGTGYCLLRSSSGGDTFHFKWDLQKYTFTNPICVLNCKNGSSGCSGAMSKDDRGVGIIAGAEVFNLKPKDDIFMTRVENGNSYQVSCCEKCLPGDTDCQFLCKKDTSILSTPLLVLSESGFLDLEPQNGTSFYPGQDIKFKWSITKPSCAGSEIRVSTYFSIGGGVSLVSTEIIPAGHVSTGVLSFPIKIPHRAGYFLMQGRITRGECEGSVDNFNFEVLRPGLTLTSSLAGQTFHKGDKINLTWDGPPSVPNNLPLGLTTILEPGNFGAKDLVIPNSGIYSYVVKEDVDRKAIISLCYRFLDTDLEDKLDQNDWRNYGQGSNMICSHSEVFQFARSGQARIPQKGFWLANAWSALSNVLKFK